MPAARPVRTAWFNETITLAGVAPLPGDTASQLPPLVLAVAVKFAVPVLVESARLCAAGTLPPDW